MLPICVDNCRYGTQYLGVGRRPLHDSRVLLHKLDQEQGKILHGGEIQMATKKKAAKKKKKH